MRAFQLRVLLIAAVNLAFLVSSVYGQIQNDESRHDFRTWYVYIGDHRIGDSDFSIHYDTQIRAIGAADGINQVLLRPGVTYDVKKWLRLTGGYGFIKSYPRDGPPRGLENSEHRLWQQLILNHKAGATPLTHRFRIEQRWISRRIPDQNGVGQFDGYSYRNRFRYFIRVAIPLGKSRDSKYYLALYNEIMFNFGKNAVNAFDQDRIYVSLGQKLGKVGNLEIGYLQQILKQSNGRVTEYNHTLQIVFSSSSPFKP